MAFHREDLITWNEFAPSFQAMLRTIQTEITLRAHKMFSKRISERLLHINALLRRHIKSDHPHANSLNCLLRQPNTHYKTGEIVFDMELPPGCYLECLTEGITGNTPEFSVSEGFITEEACEYYSTPEHINEEIREIYNLLQQHIYITDVHPKALNFLIRQSNHYYDIGEIVFNPEVPPYCYLECIQPGITSTDATTIPTLDNAPIAETLQEVDSELKAILKEINDHITNPIPHEKYKFLTRNPEYQYTTGDTVLYNARYQLECTTGGTTTTDISEEVNNFLNTVKITMIDVRWGEAILIQTPEQNILFDTGIANTATSDEYIWAVENGRKDEVYYLQRRLLLAALEKRNITTIDKLILTHAHADHIQNAWLLVGPGSNEKKKYPILKNLTVKALYDNGVVYTTAAYRKYLECAEKNNIPYQALTSGDVLNFGGGVTFTVLWPTTEYRNIVNDQMNQYINNHIDNRTEKINDTSIVGILRYKDFSIMLTGDAEKKTENSILTMYYNSINLHCDVLKLGHHGNNTSTTDEFLRAIRPDIALMSSGTLLKENRYRKLSAGIKKVTDRCLNSGIPSVNMLYTRFNGDITISVDWNGLYNISPEVVEDWLTVPERTEVEEEHIEVEEKYDDVDESKDIIIEPTEAIQENYDSDVTITVLDVRWGEAILIQTPKQNILVDTGVATTNNADVSYLHRKLLINALTKRNITTIDKLILTHPHADHIQNAWLLVGPTGSAKTTYPILKKLKVKALYDNGVIYTTAAYKKYMQKAEAQNIPYKALYAGEVLDFGGGCTFEVIWPSVEFSNRVNGYVEDHIKTGSDILGINNSSITGILRYKGFSMMLTGDTKFWSENKFLEYNEGKSLTCDVLKLGHHGYNTSTGEALLEAVMPTYVVASNGPNTVAKENRYDISSIRSNTLPVFNRCRAFGIDPSHMMYTRFNGDVTISVGSTGEYHVIPEVEENWYLKIPYDSDIMVHDTGEADDGDDSDDMDKDNVGDD